MKTVYFYLSKIAVMMLVVVAVLLKIVSVVVAVVVAAPFRAEVLLGTIVEEIMGWEDARMTDY